MNSRKAKVKTQYLALSQFSSLSKIAIQFLPRGRGLGWIGIIGYLICVLQLFSLPLYFTVQYLEDQDFGPIIVIRAICKAFIGGELFDFTSFSWFTGTVFILFQIYSWITMVSFGVLIFLVIKGIKVSLLFNKIWSRACYLHPLVFAFPLFSFHLKLCYSIADGRIALLSGVAESDAQEILIMIVSIVAIIWSLVFTVATLIFTSNPLKTKDPLTAKSKLPLLFTFFEKVFLYLIFQMFPKSNSKIWGLLLLNFCLTLIRLIHTYLTFPFYKFRIMHTKLIFCSLQFLLAALNLFGWVLCQADSRITHRFLFLTWVLLIPIVSRIASSIFQKKLMHIMEYHKSLSPKDTIYKIYVTKSVHDKRSPCKKRKKAFDFFELFFTGSSHILTAMDMKTQKKVNLDLDQPAHFRSYAKALLRNAILAYPKAQVLRIAYIDILLKYTENFNESAYLLEQLMSEHNSLSTEVSILLLKQRLEQLLEKKDRELVELSKIDMVGYINLSEKYEELKEKILAQANLHIQFWEAYLSAEFDFRVITDLSVKIHHYQTEIAHFWKELEALNKKNFMTPYLAYGFYLEALNNMPSSSLKFITEQLTNLTKLEVDNNLKELCDETLYHSDNVHFVVSGMKEDLGIVLECSPSSLKIFGYDRHRIIGKNISILMPESVKEVHDLVIIQYFETGRREMLGRTRKTLALHARGYLVPVLLHLKQNPHIQKGLNFIAVMRPLNSAEEYIRVTPDGKIDGMTQHLTELFELNDEDSEGLSIYSIATDLRKVIDAFNHIATDHLAHKTHHLELYFEEIEGEPLVQPNNDNKLNTEYEIGISEREIRPKSLLKWETMRNSKYRSRQSKLISVNSGLDSDSKLGSPRSNSQQKELFEKFSEAEQDFILYTKNKQIKCRIKMYLEYHYDSWTIVIQVHDMIIQDVAVGTLTRLDKLVTPLSRNDRWNTNGTIFYDIKSHLEVPTSPYNLKKVSFMKDLPNTFADYAKRHNMSLAAANDSAIDFPNEDEDVHILNMEKYILSPKEGKSNCGTPKHQSPNPIAMRGILSNFAGNKHLLPDAINTRPRLILQTDIKKSSPYFMNTKEGWTIHDKLNDIASSLGSSMRGGQISINQLLEEALRKKYNKGKFTIFMWIFIAIVMTIQALVLSQGIKLIHSQKETRIHSRVVQDAYYRLDYLTLVNFYTNGANVALNGYVGAYGPALYTEITPFIRYHLINLDEYNQKLSQDIEELTDPEQKKKFNIMNVKMFDNDALGLTSSYTIDNTFTAINKIILKGVKYTKNLTPTFPGRNLDAEYVLWNSLNDLVVACEKSVELMQSALQKSLHRNESKLRILTGVSSGVLFMIFLYTLQILKDMNQGMRDFADCLASMTEVEAKYCLRMIHVFIRNLKEDFQHTNFEEEYRLRKDLARAKGSQHNARMSKKNIRFRGSFARNFYLIIHLWPALIILAATLIFYYKFANTIVSSITTLHGQVTTAGNTVYYIDMIASASLEIVTKQAKTTIRNKPIVNETYEMIKTLSEIDKLVAVFRDEDGGLTPAQYRFIYGIECTDPLFDANERFKGYCHTFSQGTGKISIVDLLASFNTELVGYLDQYLKSDRSIYQIPVFMMKNLEGVSPRAVLLSNLFRGLWSSTDEKLDVYMNHEEKRIEIMISMTTCLIVLVVVLGLPRALNSIYNKENQLKSILKLVPLNIILKNKFLKSYLIRTSGKLGWSVVQAV